MRYLKLLSLISLLMFLSVPSSGKKKVEKYADITCRYQEVDFGTFSKKKPVKVARFTLKNTGNIPLVLSSADATCGCSTPYFSKKPIPPGATTYVYVRFNGMDRKPGRFYKSVRIFSNSKTGPQFLYVRGTLE